MAKRRLLPGQMRDAIVSYFTAHGDPATIAEIRAHVEATLGPVSPSSIRSSLNLQPMFKRIGRAKYEMLKGK